LFLLLVNMMPELETEGSMSTPDQHHFSGVYFIKRLSGDFPDMNLIAADEYLVTGASRGAAVSKTLQFRLSRWGCWSSFSPSFSRREQLGKFSSSEITGANPFFPPRGDSRAGTDTDSESVTARWPERPARARPQSLGTGPSAACHGP
jgi:hypothetical protein